MASAAELQRENEMLREKLSIEHQKRVARETYIAELEGQREARKHILLSYLKHRRDSAMLRGEPMTEEQDEALRKALAV